MYLCKVVVFVAAVIVSDGACVGPDCFEVLQKLPAPELVFDELFARKGSMIDKGEHDMSYALVTFVNFAIENVISTNSYDFSKNAVSSNFTIQNIISTFLHTNDVANTTLKLRSYAEAGVNPPEIKMSHAGTVQLTKDDAICPLDRQTAHWGHRVWLNVMYEAYNRIYKVVEQRFSSYSLEKRTSVVSTTIALLMALIILNEYIHVINPNVDLTDLLMDFDTRTCPFPVPPYPMDVEFIHLYQWHHLIPDIINYKQPIPVSYTVRNASGYTKYSTKDHIEAFARTRTGSNFTMNNEPVFMKKVTQETIRRARTLNLGSFNDLREKYNLTRYVSFEEFGPETSAKLKKLYRSVDDIDAQAALVLSRSTVLSAITYGAVTRFRHIHAENCKNMQALSAAMKDVIFDPRGPLAVLTGIVRIDGRHPFQAPPVSGVTKITPVPPVFDKSGVVGFGLGTGITAPRVGIPKGWKKTGPTEYKVGNVVVSYTARNVLKKVQLADSIQDIINNHTITFGVGYTTIDGETFNNTAIPYSWMPGGCNAAMGGLHYYRADRTYFPMYDVFTKDGGGPVLTGVVFTRKNVVNDTLTLDQALVDPRSAIEAHICRDRPDVIEKKLVQTQHVLLYRRDNIKTQCQNNVCKEGSMTCFACGLFSTRNIKLI